MSCFLNYGDWQCGHDEIRHCRSLDDVKSWLAQPCTGSVETGGAPFWRLLLHYRPDVRIVTIRRPVEDVVRSLRATGVVFDATLEPLMRRLDHKLDQVERRAPGVRSFTYEDLRTESACATLFEHCLSCQHDHARWQTFVRTNMQVNLHHTVRYFIAHRTQLEKVAKQAKHRMLSLLVVRPRSRA